MENVEPKKVETTKTSQPAAPEKKSEPQKNDDYPNQIYEETLPPDHRLK